MTKLNYDNICECLELIAQPTLNLGGNYVTVSNFYEHFCYGCIAIDINGEINIFEKTQDQLTTNEDGDVFCLEDSDDCYYPDGLYLAKLNVGQPTIPKIINFSEIRDEIESKEDLLALLLK